MRSMKDIAAALEAEVMFAPGTDPARIRETTSQRTAELRTFAGSVAKKFEAAKKKVAKAILELAQTGGGTTGGHRDLEDEIRRGILALERRASSSEVRGSGQAFADVADEEVAALRAAFAQAQLLGDQARKESWARESAQIRDAEKARIEEMQRRSPGLYSYLQDLRKNRR